MELSPGVDSLMAEEHQHSWSFRTRLSAHHRGLTSQSCLSFTISLHFSGLSHTPSLPPEALQGESHVTELHQSLATMLSASLAAMFTPVKHPRLLCFSWGTQDGLHRLVMFWLSIAQRGPTFIKHLLMAHSFYDNHLRKNDLLQSYKIMAYVFPVSNPNSTMNNHLWSKDKTLWSLFQAGPQKTFLENEVLHLCMPQLNSSALICLCGLGWSVWLAWSDHINTRPEQVGGSWQPSTSPIAWHMAECSPKTETACFRARHPPETDSTASFQT